MTKPYKHITTTINNLILSLTLNRIDKKNALNNEMIGEIQNTLDLNADNPDVKVILISSSCDVFCAGADLAYLEKIKNYNYEEQLNDSQQLMSLFKTMLTHPKLIISCVSGPAIAGGCGLVTASDISFATHESKFGYPEVKIGFTPALVSTFLIQKITENKARELLVTGRIIDGKEAHQIGLINYLCDQHKIEDQVFNFIQNFIKNTSAASIKRTKEIMYHSLGLDAKLNKAAEINAKSRMEDDFKKGINAFLNKESINWKSKNV